MTDLALVWNNDAWSADLGLLGYDLLTDDGLQTAVIVSLFTDRRARPDDALPDPGGDLRGWWADAFPEVEGDLIGSRLWLLERSKELASVVLKAKEYAEEALAWMIEDGVADKIVVVAADAGRGALTLSIGIARPSGDNHRFDYVWAAVSGWRSAA